MKASERQAMQRWLMGEFMATTKKLIEALNSHAAAIREYVCLKEKRGL